MPAAKPRLLVVRGPCRGQELVLKRAQMSIGRAADNDLVLSDLAVSRHHFAIYVDDAGVHVRDHGSGNGTLLNGDLLDGERTLRNGDELEIGESVIRLILAEPVGLSVPFVKTRKPAPSYARIGALVAGLATLGGAWLLFGTGGRTQTPSAPDAPPAPPPVSPPPVVITLPPPDAPVASVAPPPVEAAAPPSRPHAAPRKSVENPGQAPYAAGLARGDAAAKSDPAAALAAYQEALTADERAGGDHATLLRAKIARVAVPAAAAFVADGKLEQARAACDLAERAGADMSRVRTSLEAAAARLYAQARRAPGPDAPSFYRRILRIVPSSSQWHEKALAALGEAP